MACALAGLGMPAPVHAATPSIAVGPVTGCAVKESGLAFCWGWNVTGQLGNGQFTTGENQSISRPVQVQTLGFEEVVAVTAGMQHTCGLTTSGAAYCWGANFFGQLGVGNRVDSAVPLPVATLSSGVRMISSGGLHTCAVTTAGAALCWGWAAYGQVGAGFYGSMDGSSLPDRPFPVEGLSSGVESIAAGGTHTCAVTTGGAALCWGRNTFGQLGDGTLEDRPGPVPVVGLESGVAAIAASGTHTCALLTNGSVRCWGHNDSGQLGNEVSSYDFERRSTIPVPVPGLPGPVRSLSASTGFPREGGHTCAVTNAGALYCWGSNSYGQLGNGGTMGRETFNGTPTVVGSMSSGVAAAGTGIGNTCALMTSGAVFCWGWNDYGQVGDNTLTRRLWPTAVVRELGNGNLATNDWYLNLRSTPASIPAELTPSLLAAVRGRATTVSPSGDALGSTLSVLADVRFRASDLGNPIYVFAYRPRRTGLAKDGHAACELAQVGPSGTVVAVSASSLQAYTTGVTAAAQQSVTVLDKVAASPLEGATLCVGTGPDSTSAVAASNSRCVATVPSPGGVCTGPDESPARFYPGALSGLWWNANESGWGMHLTQRRDIVFASWFTYDAAGGPKWFVASSCRMTSTSATRSACDGALYEVSGPTFFGTAFDPGAVRLASAGSVLIDFNGTGEATLSYRLGEQARSVPLTRQVFSSGSPPNGVDYTDLWWNPHEAGWGMAVTQQGPIIFLAWYVYDASGRPVWYVASNCAVAGNGCSGALFRTTGPPFGPTFDASRVQVFEAGTVRVDFTGPNNGTLSYTVGGVTSRKPITRQLF